MKRGLSLAEVLVGMGIFAVCAIPLIALITGSRRNTEFNARHLEAVYICQKVIEQVNREAIVRFDNLVVEPGPMALVKMKEDDQVSHYFRRFVANPETFDSAFPFLRAHLQNFCVSVDVQPFDGNEDLREIQATVYFRLSPGHPQWHDFTMRTVILRRSAF